MTGVSGLINVPNTITLPVNRMEASIHVYSGQALASINVAVAQQVEVGAFTTNQYGPLRLTVKGVVVAESEDMPGIAVGMDGTSTYIVMSHKMQTAHGYLGVGGRFGGVFGGLSMEVKRAQPSQRDPVTTLIMEHDGKSVNLGVRMVFPASFMLDAALINMERFMIGVTLVTGF